jgi:hypothetical protein
MPKHTLKKHKFLVLRCIFGMCHCYLHQNVVKTKRKQFFLIQKESEQKKKKKTQKNETKKKGRKKTSRKMMPKKI